MALTAQAAHITQQSLKAIWQGSICHSKIKEINSLFLNPRTSLRLAGRYLQAKNMIQNHITVKNRHEKFIKTICETEIVYGLKNNEGFATSSSVHYDDENGEPVGMICFWAEKARAKSCIKDGWENYEPTEIPLAEFMENWCVGMENDGLLIGTQFDQNMFGFEAEPLELIIELTAGLKSIGKNLVLKKFNGIEDLEAQVKAIIE